MKKKVTVKKAVSKKTKRKSTKSKRVTTFPVCYAVSF